ncbi:UNVERIFIED_CONTAM: hypothetical protein FKN15_059604 [Acipenser sinensis]
MATCMESDNGSNDNFKVGLEDFDTSESDADLSLSDNDEEDVEPRTAGDWVFITYPYQDASPPSFDFAPVYTDVQPAVELESLRSPLECFLTFVPEKLIIYLCDCKNKRVCSYFTGAAFSTLITFTPLTADTITTPTITFAARRGGAPAAFAARRGGAPAAFNTITTPTITFADRGGGAPAAFTARRGGAPAAFFTPTSTRRGAKATSTSSPTNRGRMPVGFTTFTFITTFTCTTTFTTITTTFTTVSTTTQGCQPRTAQGCQLRIAWDCFLFPGTMFLCTIFTLPSSGHTVISNPVTDLTTALI